MNEKLLFFILVMHFFADFALQTHEQAINKYKCREHLFFHVMTYSLTWMCASMFFLDSVFQIGAFFIITFICHWVTDAITSNMSKPFFDKKDFHNGFVVVGFDQVLHYVQLYLTFKLLL